MGWGLTALALKLRIEFIKHYGLFIEQLTWKWLFFKALEKFMEDTCGCNKHWAC